MWTLADASLQTGVHQLTAAQIGQTRRARLSKEAQLNNRIVVHVMDGQDIQQPAHGGCEQERYMHELVHCCSQPKRDAFQLRVLDISTVRVPDGGDAKFHVFCCRLQLAVCPRLQRRRKTTLEPPRDVEVAAPGFRWPR